MPKKTVQKKLLRCAYCGHTQNISPLAVLSENTNYGRCKKCGLRTLVKNEPLTSDYNLPMTYMKRLFSERLGNNRIKPSDQIIIMPQPIIPKSAYEKFCKQAHSIMSKYNDVMIMKAPTLYIKRILPFQATANKDLYAFLFDSMSKQSSLWVDKNFSPCLEGMGYNDFSGNDFIYNDYGIAITTTGIIMEDEDLVRENLNLRQIIKLPPIPGKMRGYIKSLDCFMNFIDNDTLVLLDSHDAIEAAYLDFVCKQIKKECPELNIEIMPTGRNGKPGTLGLYTTFVETIRAVFVPQFGLPTDALAIDCIKSHTGKPVVGVDCRELVKEGLTLADVTKVYWL